MLHFTPTAIRLSVVRRPRRRFLFYCYFIYTAVKLGSVRERFVVDIIVLAGLNGNTEHHVTNFA